jgi:hypothetical protein
VGVEERFSLDKGFEELVCIFSSSGKFHHDKEMERIGPGA